MGAKLSQAQGRRDGKVELFLFYCPGCRNDHGFYTKAPKGPTWTFNGNMEAPTVTPSIRVLHPQNLSKTRCHLFITDGKIRFLPDCKHDLAGQTVPMETYDATRGWNEKGPA